VAYSFLYHIHIFSKCFVFVQQGTWDTGDWTSMFTVIGGKRCCGSLFNHSSL